VALIDQLSPGELERLARLALELSVAIDASLPDLTHRAHVLGILRGAAPTFSAALERLTREAGRTRAHVATQSLHRGRDSA
jgi:hypothetical protein